MQLFIRSGDLYTEIPTVTLRDGYMPVVGELKSSPLLQDKQLQIEPAIWFKTLALDSVSIDCTRRAIMWNSDSNQQQQPVASVQLRKMNRRGSGGGDSPVHKRKKISQSMYLGGELYGFESELDELFDTMQAALAEFGHAKLQTDDFYETVMRLLHCYVLPAITMTQEDVLQLERVFVQQEGHILQVDEQIIKKNKQIEDIKTSLRNQREKYVQELSKNDTPHPDLYKGEFAAFLKLDVDKDIEYSSHKLDELQQLVEEAKVMSICTNGSTESEDVQLRRVERNSAFEEHQKLLHARENLKDLTTPIVGRRRSLTESIRHSFRSKRSIKKELNPLHNIYLEMHSKIGTLREETIDLVDKKILMISIKEAIRNTLSEIKETSESQGIDTDRTGGSRSTHVLRQSRIPKEWLTLTEQVAVSLMDTKGKISEKHREFTETVVKQCRAAVFEKYLLDLTTPQSHATDGQSKSDVMKDIAECSDEWQNSSCQSIESVSEPEVDGLKMKPNDQLKNTNETKDCNSTVMSVRHRESLISLEGELGCEDIVIVHDLEQNHMKITVETLKTTIKDHFDEMVNLFENELNIKNFASHKKLWLCYEAHFYDAVMFEIIKVYEHTYSHISEKICEGISDLDIKDLNLEETIVASLLHDSNNTKHNVCFMEPKDLELAAEQQENNATLNEGSDLQNENVAYFVESNTPDKKVSLRKVSTESSDSLNDNPQCLRQTSAPAGHEEVKPDNHVKKVKIHYPSSVTMIYNRRTWPIPALQSFAGEFECGMDALALDSDDTDSNSEPQEQASPETEVKSLVIVQNTCDAFATQNRKMKIRAKFRKHFSPAMDCMKDAINESVPLLKLQSLTRCLREIVQSISNLQTEELHMNVAVCCDNLLDMLVVLLCNFSTELVTKLYTQVMMLTDLMSPCLMNGPYEYSLLQFFGAFQIIQERVVVKSRGHFFNTV